MNKLFVLLSFFALFFIDDAMPVIMGIKMYRPNEKTTLIVLFDKHFEPHLRGAQEYSRLDQQKRDLNSLTNELKSFAHHDKAHVFYFVEGHERQKKQDLAKSSYLLVQPLVDSACIGMSQKKFRYIWYDLRDEEDKKLIFHPPVAITPQIRERAMNHRQEALKQINCAALGITTKRAIKTVLQLNKSQNIAKAHNLIQCLSRDTDAFLIKSVFEKINSQEDTIIVAFGGGWHMAALCDVAEQEGLLLSEKRGMTTQQELDQDSNVWLDYFNDIVVDRLGNPHTPLLPQLRSMPKKEILPLRIIDSPMQRELLPEMPLQELPSKLRERRARIRPFVLC